MSPRHLSLLLAASIPFTGNLTAENAPAPVNTVQPAPVKHAADYTFPGRTEPYLSARVFTRATGIVKERTVDIGDRVTEGDTLAIIDAPDLDRAVEAAKALVDQTKVRTTNAKAQAERAATLLERNAISLEEADQRVADAAAAEAAERVASAELARLEEQQRFTIVKAPFDAVVAARNFERGDRVRGDSATSEGWLFHLVQLRTLRFAVQVAPELALRLTDESEATIRFNELPGQEFKTKVSRTSRIFDASNGTMRVETEIENEDLRLPAGLTGIAVFSVPPKEGTYMLPSNTILTRTGNTTVAVVREGKVAFIDVITGRNLGINTEVTSPHINPEVQVIINPNALLQEGDAVSIQTTAEQG